MEMIGTERTTRQEQAQQTKRRLFDAAYSLLQEKDFKDITIGDIVTRAGVSAGTFYLYYQSKLDAYYQTYLLADAYFAKEVAPKLQAGSTLQKLLVFFDDYANYNSDYTGLKLTKLLYNSENKCFLRQDVEEGMHSVLLTVVQEGLATGALDGSMTDIEICDFLMSAVRGLVYDWCIHDGDFDLKEAMRRYVLRLYRGIQKET